VTDAGLQTVDGLAGTTQRIYQIRRCFASLPLPPMGPSSRSVVYSRE
jgi:hypothetical protein